MRPGAVAAPLVPPPLPAEWNLPSKGRVGMASLIVTESAFFSIFIVAHLYYLGKSLTPPYADIFEAPIVATICLLSSSFPIMLATRTLARGKVSAFLGWWLLTIALGAVFLVATLFEWKSLIEQGLTLRANLLGTTYYSLVGFHALHVTVGLFMLGLVAVLTMLGYVQREHAERCEVLSWYWHFVDGVWVAVFTVVYLIR
jgi:cytochrome c oxidase subunit 3/cytochrome o ubiquinol oxidase subunit 3